MDYYDTDGNKVSPEEGLKLFKNDRVIALDNLPGDIQVSTVHLVLDHSFGDGPPLIFETMVFEGRDWSGIDEQRYATYEQAIEGHQSMVIKWTGYEGE